MPDGAGVLIVDKPAGWTSFDVVAFVRRRSGVRRVGHAGTLDPLATGVLPVCIGQATRFIEYLVDSTKTYVADVTLGVETNTYDAEGEVLQRRDTSGVTEAGIEAALERFRGEIEQTPPAYSAIKRDGVPLYKLARRGEEVTVEPRRVRVDRLALTSCEPPLLRLEVDCSKGFYVRSLAHDIGGALGVGGMLSGLRRTRVGDFGIEDATGIDALGAAFEAGTWTELLRPPDELLLRWQAAILCEDSSRRLRNGQRVRLQPLRAATNDRCRAYSSGGDFLGVLAAVEAGVWRPEKIVGV